MSLKKSYLKHCKDKNLEINENQIKIVQKLSEYYNLNFGQSFIKKLFKDKKNKLGFYLVGDVGVGKTMILNFLKEMCLMNIIKLRKMMEHLLKSTVLFGEMQSNFI
ncbi:hypothetical protein OA976_00860 [Candidatus Pelagibacter sp.]|nr:hypothetical protein [Candidatus Pelagibacter sp.]